MKNVKNEKSKLTETQLKKVKEIGEVSILPINSYVVIMPFDKNPFRKLTIQDDIITKVDEPEIYNSDTGEVEDAELIERVGVVVEVSEMCKNDIKPNDFVLYRSSQALPTPIFGTNYDIVPEQGIYLVVREPKE